MSKTRMYSFECGCELWEELNSFGEISPRWQACRDHFHSSEIYPEDHIEQMFRDRILRFWDRNRIVKFCLHLMGAETAEW